MQKKLLAVAVAGALGAPAVALAQNATVNVYGRLYAEYGYIKQGATSPVAAPVAGTDLNTVDFLQNPGSNIGFRGEEKLGGGTSVWFQCESSMDWRGTSVDGWCSRNSALGIKGAWGNFYAGNWHTPFQRAITQGMVGANETGLYGAAQLLGGQSTTTNSGAASGGTFFRRQRNAIAYDSPNFSGFQVNALYTNTNADTASLTSATGTKARVQSISAVYNNGPLVAYATYEKHKDVTGAAAARSEDGWAIGGAYTFPNKLKVGGLYTRQTWERGTAAAPTEGSVNAWHVGMDWSISGPHGVRAAYTRAGDIKNNSVAAFGGIGAGNPPYRPAFNAAGGTSASLYSIRYVHTLSKRTEFTFGYAKMDNKTNAAYQIYGLSSNANGHDQSGFALALDHRF